MHMTWSDYELNERYDKNNNFVAFIALINFDFELVHNIKFDTDFKCEFDSLYDGYEAFLNKSLRVKAESVKVDNRALKVTNLNNSIKLQNDNILNKILL